ncbi:MAG: zf-HC2 domain-containing protein [Thermodesulfobacteriota bacterium]|nr:zf-HC2 domain-containing protein [Thermodesulfobacteriota bacterium]
MKCAGIKQLLSEYIDGVLDADTKAQLEEHILQCTGCRQALEDLEALVGELRAVEPVKAPDDFLDQLHERIEPRFSLTKIMKTLFVPMKIKIPIQLVTVTATAVLVFSVINLQQPVMQLSDAPMVSEEEEVKLEVMKKPVKPTPDRKTFMQKPASTKIVTHKKPKTTKAKDIALKGLRMEKATDKKAFARTMQKEKKTIELALVLKTGEPGRANLQFAPKEKAPSPERGEASDEESRTYADSSSRLGAARKKAPKAVVETSSFKEDREDKALPDSEPSESKNETFGVVTDVNQRVKELENLIERLNGKILYIEYEEESRRPKSLTAQIPATQYNRFYEKLKSLGTLQGLAPAINEKKKEMIKVKVRFITSK